MRSIEAAKPVGSALKPPRCRGSILRWGWGSQCGRRERQEGALHAEMPDPGSARFGRCEGFVRSVRVGEGYTALAIPTRLRPSRLVRDKAQSPAVCAEALLHVVEALEAIDVPDGTVQASLPRRIARAGTARELHRAARSNRPLAPIMIARNADYDGLCRLRAGLTRRFETSGKQICLVARPAGLSAVHR